VKRSRRACGLGFRAESTPSSLSPSGQFLLMFLRTRNDVDLPLAAERRHLRSPARQGLSPNPFRAHERGPCATPAGVDCRCRSVPVAARLRRLPPANLRHAFSVLVVRAGSLDTSQTGVGQQGLTHWATEMPPLRGSGSRLASKACSFVFHQASAVSSLGMSRFALASQLHS
jgi:hypothetical protein